MRHRGESWAWMIGLAVATLPFCVVFSLWTASSGWAWIRFLLGLLFIAYLPGRFLLTGLRSSVGELERALFALVIGLVSSALLAWIGLRLGFGRAWLAWPSFTLVHALVSARRSGLPTPTARWVHVGLSCLFLLVCIPLATTPVHYRNLVRLGSGAMRDFAFDDATLHISIVRELGHSIPPQIPFLPGSPLTYHYAPDFVVRLFVDVSQVSVLDATLRFMPTLYMGLAVVAIFCFARVWLRREGFALLTVALVLLGDDFSFVPGLWMHSPDAWAAHLFRVPTTPSLYTLNPMLPALGLLFTALLSLTHFVRAEDLRTRWRWGVAASILVAALFVVKVFTAAHLLGCLSLAACVQTIWRRSPGLLAVLGLTCLFAMPAIAWMSFEGSGLFSIEMGPSGLLTSAVHRIGIAQTGIGRHVIAFEAAPGLGAHALWYFLVALPGFLLASFGARSLGLALLLRRPWGREELGDPMRLLLWAFVISGPVATLFFTIRPTEFPQAYDNAVWFFVQSKFVAWIPAVEALLYATRNGSAGVRRIAAALLLAASLPSGLQYVARSADGMAAARERILPRPQLEMLAFLDEVGAPGEVVLAPPPIAESVLTLTRKRSPLLHLYTDSFVSRAELASWQRDRQTFWSDWSRGRIRWEVVERRGARWLVDRRSESKGPLEPVFRNDAFVVYDLRRE